MSRPHYTGSPRPDEPLDGRVRPRLTRRDFLLGGTALLCGGCATAPVTGRRQFMAISPEEEVALGLQAYREVLHREPITHDPKATAPLRRIVARLAPAAEQAAGRSDFQWEVNAIKDDQTVNALCSPGARSACTPGFSPSRRRRPAWP